MVKIAKKTNSSINESVSVANADALDNTENEFDLKVLEKDIENSLKEQKEAYQKKVIEQANLQKDAEVFQEIEEKEQDFNESLREILNYALETINRRLDKINITKFENDFVDKLIDKIIAVIPKHSLEKAKEFLGSGNKAKSGIRLIKVASLITFLSRELYSRYDEYITIKKAEKLKTQQPE